MRSSRCSDLKRLHHTEQMTAVSEFGFQNVECGMRNDGIALLSLFYALIKDPQEWTSKFKTDRFVITYQ